MRKKAKMTGLNRKTPRNRRRKITGRRRTRRKTKIKSSLTALSSSSRKSSEPNEAT